MIIGIIEQKTNIRYKNLEGFESYINAKDIDYDSEDSTFIGYTYKLKTPQFKVVKRSGYAKGTSYRHEITKYYGRNCYITTSGHCFIKCLFHFTGKDYTEEF